MWQNWEWGSPLGNSHGATGMCVSFQDHETSFPRALSAQRLSPRWCFLDGECCFSSPGTGGGWSQQGRAWIDRMTSLPKIIPKAFLKVSFCISNEAVGLLMPQHLCLSCFLQALGLQLVELSVTLLKLTFFFYHLALPTTAECLP